jgi:hypothetical protein
VRIDSRGRLLVVDRENDRIQIFDTEGKYLSKWAFEKPIGMYFDADGIIHVLEEEKRRILQVTEDGEITGHWGTRGDEPGEFTGHLHTIAVDSRGDAYICEAHHPDRLQKFERL